ncbi:MAG: cytochrome D1 domain-containing protein [Verrucomicrobiota bacterium]
MKISLGAFALTLALAVLSLASHAAPAAAKAFDSPIKNNSLAITPDESLALACYSDLPEVVVYSLKTGRVVNTLRGFVTPRTIVVSPKGDTVYISDSSLGRILVYDTATMKLKRRYAVGLGAFGTTLSRDGRYLCVNNEAANTVTILDTEIGITVETIRGFAQPRQGIRFSPDGATLYVTNFTGDDISVVDFKTRKITGTIGGLNQIRAISITKDGRTLFAGNSGTNEVLVVDLARRTIVKRIPVGLDPYGAALSPDNTLVISGNRKDNSVSIIDARNFNVIATLSGFSDPRQAIVFSRDSSRAYVLNKDLSIAVIDPRHYAISRVIGPPTPVAMAKAQL